MSKIIHNFLRTNIYQVDTLIKYLVDSLQSYESGHGDALHPIPLNPEKIFMGDDLALKPVTNQEFYQVKHSISCLGDKLDAIMSTVASPTTDARPPDHLNRDVLQVNSCAGPVRSQTVTHQSRSNYLPYCQPATVSISPIVPSSTISEDTIYPSNPASNDISTLPMTLPISGVSIPDLGHGSGAWKRAIRQWEEVDPSTKCALKDWPKHWYSGAMRTITGSKRSQRQIVFEEYERYNFYFLATWVH